jgi:hypothetical protein
MKYPFLNIITDKWISPFGADIYAEIMPSKDAKKQIQHNTCPLVP